MVRALVLVCVAMLVVGSVAALSPVAGAADLQPAVQCGFATGTPEPTVETVRHSFGEVVVGRTSETTADAGDWTAADGPSMGSVDGPDAGQFRVTAGETATGSPRLSFVPTTPGTKRAWVVVDGETRTTVHCLVGTAVVAGASRSGGDGGDRVRSGRDSVGGASGEAAGAGGGGVIDVFRGFGREFVESVTRGVVSVVTLEFARNAVVGAGAAWAAGEGVVGKAVSLAGYTLSGIDPTAGLRKGVPAAVAAWRVGDFEGAGRALFGVVESVVFTGAAAAGAWEGSKRAKGFVQERREGPVRASMPGRDDGLSMAAYRDFSTSIDAAVSAGLSRANPSGREDDGRPESSGAESAAGAEDADGTDGTTTGSEPTAVDGSAVDEARSAPGDETDRDDRRELV